jgi:hypothetical protein
MADDRPDDQKIAKWTFWATAGLALLYVGAIFVFILYR